MSYFDLRKRLEDLEFEVEELKRRIERLEELEIEIEELRRRIESLEDLINAER